jgi:hypothetical protein
MSVKLVGKTTKIWTYTATGIVPTGLPPEPGFLERAVRSAVNWNDTMLAWLRNTTVTEEELSEEQVRSLMTDFERRLGKQ